MNILTNNTIMLKTFLTYSAAIAIVTTGFFIASVTPAQAATTTYLLDLTGNGCGNQCAELYAYLDSINKNTTTTTNSNNGSTSSSTTSTSTSTSSTNGSGNGGNGSVGYTPAPYMNYQYSPSTLAYYQNKTGPNATTGTGSTPTAPASTVGKYPAYSYYQNPANAYYGAQYPQNNYPTNLGYVYNSQPGAQSAQLKAKQVAGFGQAPVSQYGQYNPYTVPTANPYSNTGFTMTSR